MAVGATQKTIATKQIEFATAMLKRLKEEKGSRFIEFTEKATIKGANQYTFYRVGASTVGAGEFNMYADNYAGTNGETAKYVAEIDYVYAHAKILRKDLNSTSLDLKGTFISSLTDALKRNVDKLILDCIKAKGFNTTVGTEEDNKCILQGDTTKTLSDPATIDTLVETAVFMATLAKETSVQSTDVCIVLDPQEFAVLHRAEKVINNNYPVVNKLMNNTLFGCEVIKVAMGLKDKGILLVARGAIGTASWENDVEANSEWLFGQDCLAVKCSRSLGVVILDEKAIYKIQYKA